MAGSGDLAGFAAFLAGTIVHVEHARHQALDEASKLVLDEARSLPGHPQSEWPALSPSTVDRKTKGADSVLLETGELRESYQRTVGHDEAHVGSNFDRALYHELGTSKMPPRPVLLTAAVHKETEVRALLGRKTVAALARG